MPADTTSVQVPWLCGRCGHFAVSYDAQHPPAHQCTVAQRAVTLDSYTGSEQAESIRRRLPPTANHPW